MQVKAQHRLHKRYMRLAAAGKDRERSPLQLLVNCWASSGPWNRSRDYGQPADRGLTKEKAKAKTFWRAKTTQSMNIVANFEHRASSSRGKHEGESSSALCGRLGSTRDPQSEVAPDGS